MAAMEVIEKRLTEWGIVPTPRTRRPSCTAAGWSTPRRTTWGWTCTTAPPPSASCTWRASGARHGVHDRAWPVLQGERHDRCPKNCAASASASRTTCWSPRTAARTSPRRSPATPTPSRPGWRGCGGSPSAGLACGVSVVTWRCATGPSVGAACGAGAGARSSRPYVHAAGPVRIVLRGARRRGPMHHQLRAAHGPGVRVLDSGAVDRFTRRTPVARPPVPVHHVPPRTRLAPPRPPRAASHHQPTLRTNLVVDTRGNALAMRERAACRGSNWFVATSGRYHGGNGRRPRMPTPGP